MIDAVIGTTPVVRLERAAAPGMAALATQRGAGAELRKGGLERLEQAMWVILETDGRISVVPKRDRGVAPAETPGEERAA